MTAFIKNAMKIPRESRPLFREEPFANRQRKNVFGLSKGYIEHLVREGKLKPDEIDRG